LEAEKQQLLEFAQQQQQTAEQLQSIIEMSETGTWERNVQTGENLFNQQYANILGYDLHEIYPLDFQIWESRVHPDDLKKTTHLLYQNINNETPYYEAEYRMKHRDGHWVWIRDRGKVAER